MTYITALVLGLVEGLTEFLPVSSTAHLILASDLMGLAQSEFLKSFEVSIQAGAILAVIVLFWRKFMDLEILKRVAAAFVPTAVVGFILYAFIKEYLIGNITVVLWALALGGLILMFFERFFGDKTPVGDLDQAESEIRTLGYGRSAVIGIFQAVSVVPGVSRAAASIIGSLICGLRREAAVEFSFLLAVPTVIAAAGYDLFKSSDIFIHSDWGLLAVGLIASFVTATIAIKFLLKFVKNHSIFSFGVYRILVVAIFLLIL